MSEKRTCRVAVSSVGENLASTIGPLGRSPFFILFEGSPDKHRVIRNEKKSRGEKLGVDTAEFLIRNNIDILITGTLGKESFNILQKAGIKVHGGCSGKVSESIQSCLEGKLPECKGAAYAGSIEAW